MSSLRTVICETCCRPSLVRKAKSLSFKREFLNAVESGEWDCYLSLESLDSYSQGALAFLCVKNTHTHVRTHTHIYSYFVCLR